LPFVDSYITDNAGSDGMRARPVIGGVFIKMLENAAVWKKWASRDGAKAGGWAPAPVPPRITELVPTAEHVGAVWRYSLVKPADDWARPGFDDRGWNQGPAGFGTSGTPGAVVGTTWNTSDIWLRRAITLPATTDPSRTQLRVFHDEDVEVYVDGVLAARQPGYVTTYEHVDIQPAAGRLLRPGATVVLGVHCHQTGGGQGVDVGLVDVVESQP
jgi:hypothetical protein